MSELDLTALAEAAKVEPNIAPLKEINTALKACTFGRFHVKLLFAAFFAIMTGTFINTSTGYLLPIAECDLNMNLIQKGLLNAMPFIGMLLSSLVGGFLTDAFGRKVFLVYSFGGIFIMTLISGSSQTYEVLIAAKFFEGMLFASCFSALVSLTSEFCHNDIRDRVVLFQSSLLSMAQVVIGLISWGMLSKDWKLSLFDGKFVLNTWNFYLYAVSLWSLAACILYATLLPESPKYLVTQKKYDEARQILIKVYMENTGKPADTCPFINIWKDKTKHTLDETPEHKDENSFRHQIVVALQNVKPMFEKPLVVYLILICSINFVSMAVYHVFRLWYPQLSAIVENYRAEGSKDLCVMLDAYTGGLNQARNVTDNAVCVPTKSGDETYINSIIIGLVCFTPYLVTGLLVNKVGKKRLLIVSGSIAMASIVSLKWAGGKAAIVSLFSVTIALAQLMISLNQALTVQVFGTTTRSLALSFMMLSGRFGTLTGNIFFPILLEVGCAEMFFTVAGFMTCVTTISIFMPTKK